MHNQALTDVRSRGAGIKCLCCNLERYLLLCLADRGQCCVALDKHLVEGEGPRELNGVTDHQAPERVSNERVRVEATNISRKRKLLLVDVFFFKILKSDYN